MKHLFTKLPAMVCALLAGAAMTSCDSSDNDGMQTSFERMEINYVYAVSSDLLEIADISITYTDPADGSTKTVELTERSLSLKFQVKSFPASFTVSAAAALKPDANLDRSSYELSSEISTEFLEYRSDGKVYWFYGPDVTRTASIVEIEQGNPGAVPEGINDFIGSLAKSHTYTIVQRGDGTYTVQSV